jgi:hypothetical protein
VSPVRYEQGSYISEDAILHSHCRENLRSCMLYMYLYDERLQHIYTAGNVPMKVAADSVSSC